MAVSKGPGDPFTTFLRVFSDIPGTLYAWNIQLIAFDVRIPLDATLVPQPTYDTLAVGAQVFFNSAAIGVQVPLTNGPVNASEATAGGSIDLTHPLLLRPRGTLEVRFQLEGYVETDPLYGLTYDYNFNVQLFGDLLKARES